VVTLKDIARLREKTAAADPGAAKRLLQTPATAAVALLPACKQLLGEVLTWEPETLWVELQRRGIDVPNENRVKIQAALTLRFVPSFYWDGIVYEKTALAFDGEIPNPDALEEATAAQLAWAVKEAAWIRAWLDDPTLDFDHEPCAYTAVVLRREGFVVTPDQLQFAQGQLNRMNLGDIDLVKTVQDRWKALDKTRLDVHAFQETQADVQLARLAAVELHIRDRDSRASADLAALT
jgi:hypothetical protein